MWRTLDPPEQVSHPDGLAPPARVAFSASTDTGVNGVAGVLAACVGTGGGAPGGAGTPGAADTPPDGLADGLAAPDFDGTPEPAGEPDADPSSAVLVNRDGGFPSSVRWSRHERVGRQPNSFCALAVSMPEASGRETGRSAVVDPGYAAFHDADRSREPIVSAAAM